MFSSDLYMWASDSDLPNQSRIDKTDTEHAKSKRSKPIILVVDDEHLIAETTGQILKRAGYHALTAFDGDAALALAIQFEPDIVLTDVVMPGMSGVDLAIAIRRSLPNTEVVLFSGQAGITDLLENGHNHGYSFELIAKPVHPERILERIKKLLSNK